MSGGLEVIPVPGLPDIVEGDDLGAMLAGAADLRHGDVLVVTQKVVSKAEGRVVRGPKDAWVPREARRVVARRGDLVVAETAHGFVCASAGVDESNVPRGSVSLLPEDPDASAARIRDTVREGTGVEVAVVVSDTFGRPWRRGLVDVAIGIAGMPALVDLRGAPDLYGRPLEVTVVALADQAAAAAGLVMAKAEGIPAAVVRGLAPSGEGRARDVVRPPEEDLFRYGPLEAIVSYRTTGTFGPGRIPREVLQRAVTAAVTAPVPHGSHVGERSWLWVVLESRGAREALLGRMAVGGVRNLRSDDLLGRAPVLAVPHLSIEGADETVHRPPEERDMVLLATGAVVQRFMLALHAQGYGSAWVCPNPIGTDEAREAVGLEEGWLPMGVVACGPPSRDAPPQDPVDPGGSLRFA